MEWTIFAVNPEKLWRWNRSLWIAYQVVSVGVWHYYVLLRFLDFFIITNRLAGLRSNSPVSFCLNKDDLVLFLPFSTIFLSLSRLPPPSVSLCQALINLASEKKEHNLASCGGCAMNSSKQTPALRSDWCETIRFIMHLIQASLP